MDDAFIGKIVRKTGYSAKVLILIAIAAGVVVAGLWGEGWVKFIGFFFESMGFALQCTLIVGVALFVVWLSQLVRSMDKFDKHGAAKEMDTVRKRVGTDDEQPNDAIATAIQYGSTTILVAFVLLSFFMIHG